MPLTFGTIIKSLSICFISINRAICNIMKYTWFMQPFILRTAHYCFTFVQFSIINKFSPCFFLKRKYGVKIIPFNVKQNNALENIRILTFGFTQFSTSSRFFFQFVHQTTSTLHITHYLPVSTSADSTQLTDRSNPLRH